MSPTLPLPLNLVVPGSIPSQMFNPPDVTATAAATVVLDTTGAVPLVKPKKPEACTEVDQPYPPPSQSPLFLQTSPNSPKHINNSSAQVETGLLAADSEEAF